MESLDTAVVERLEEHISAGYNRVESRGDLESASITFWTFTAAFGVAGEFS